MKFKYIYLCCYNCKHVQILIHICHKGDDCSCWSSNIFVNSSIKNNVWKYYTCTLQPQIYYDIIHSSYLGWISKCSTFCNWHVHTVYPTIITRRWWLFLLVIQTNQSYYIYSYQCYCAHPLIYMNILPKVFKKNIWMPTIHTTNLRIRFSILKSPSGCPNAERVSFILSWGQPYKRKWMI